MALRRITLSARIEARMKNNPVRTAEQRYITANGVDRMNELLDRLASELLSQQP